MKNFKVQKNLPFLISAIIQHMQTDELHTLIAIEESNLDLPPTDLISAEIKRQIEAPPETTLRIQEVDTVGTVIDEFELTLPETYLDEDAEPPTVYEELLTLSRLSKIKQATGDHNYRQVNEAAVLLLAQHHSGFSDDEDSVSMGGPLADYVTPQKKDELWNDFLARQVLSNDCHKDNCESQDET